jgi:hypothetical protein
MNIEVVFAGGYYQLLNIRVNEKSEEFCDIYLLS